MAKTISPALAVMDEIGNVFHTRLWNALAEAPAHTFSADFIAFQPNQVNSAAKIAGSAVGPLILHAVPKYIVVTLPFDAETVQLIALTNSGPGISCHTAKLTGTTEHAFVTFFTGLPETLLPIPSSTKDPRYVASLFVHSVCAACTETVALATLRGTRKCTYYTKWTAALHTFCADYHPIDNN